MYDAKRAGITARDAVRRYNAAEGTAAKEKVILDYLYHCNEVGERDGFEFGGAKIKALAMEGGPVPLVIRFSRDRRNDPKLAPLLDHMKAALLEKRKG